ncbi:MAG: T9SS type A sorting domain-containing protein [Ignavibacteriaceae bacterium]
MKNFTHLVLCILFLVFNDLPFAQFTHTFNPAGSVQAFSAYNVGTGSDGTVFLAHSSEGLYAYNHSDTTFYNMRHISNPRGQSKPVERSDGIVFMAYYNSVYAITYTDTSLAVIDQLNLGSPFTMDVAIGPDGTVFVATQSGGIFAFSFTLSTSFTLLDQINDPITVDGIAVGPDSIIYVAGRNDGFYAFSFYDDSTFTQLDNIDVSQAWNVTVGSDGTVFFANGNIGGLLVYTFNGVSFDSVTNWMDPMGAFDVAVASDGTIFLANSLDGLRAFTFDGSTLTNTAHIDPGSNTRDVAIGIDGVIFTANFGSGWYAFTYDAVTSSENNYDLIPDEFQLFQNYPNPFNPSTKISWQSPIGSHQTLKIYDLLGNEVATLVDENLPAGNYDIDFDASGLASGIYFYQLKSGNYFQSKKMLLLK